MCVENSLFLGKSCQLDSCVIGVNLVNLRGFDGRMRRMMGKGAVLRWGKSAPFWGAGALRGIVERRGVHIANLIVLSIEIKTVEEFRA